MPSNENRQRVLEALLDGEFHSGAHLAGQLGLSRTAVNNHIQALESLGLDIYSVKGKGYRLACPMTLLNREAIASGLSSSVYLFDEVESTNSFLLQNLGQLASGDCCLAERQSQGRGRRGRQWISPYAGSLYLSLYWRLPGGVAQAGGLSLVVGVLLVDALESLGITGVSVKWPNDLYYGEAKLAGILVEMRGQYGEPADMVIGCGINVNLGVDAAAEIDRAWTDLRLVTGEPVDRNRLANAVIRHLQQGLTLFEAQGLAPFIERWRRHDRYLGKPVRILLGESEVLGVAAGIDANGALLLETEDGIRAFNSGEVSLRPLT
ncbi:bifunctional biotin--[acetyl-CoA-carboxylase] ligase/biotin operon repressor BirA [Ferrimonas sediminicola]|uniref:Bifunctional ligase/repressor BirA n=1 Tax=Ferrimonas sediminicola TaxID=2569538 RepID=A0A4U1B7D5_9GAMM|nr:bifunctional biotin--[acetyl-CoA-carboxylase] ligase/biotin operon repressor BirA [Ferrimonas sediminicola]TKB46518.1 bifunctional biotin--[acetyl-CoA-carboxylase] ligase/biotin operon repressor BirA [Ferrimonas sediminicola]